MKRLLFALALVLALPISLFAQITAKGAFQSNTLNATVALGTLPSAGAVGAAAIYTNGTLTCSTTYPVVSVYITRNSQQLLVSRIPTTANNTSWVGTLSLVPLLTGDVLYAQLTTVGSGCINELPLNVQVVYTVAAGICYANPSACVTVSGSLNGANGISAPNETITLQPSQISYLAGAPAAPANSSGGNSCPLGTECAVNFPGSDPCTQINNATAQAVLDKATTVDARGIVQPWVATATCLFNQPLNYILPAGILAFSGNPGISNTVNGVHVYGAGAALNTYAAGSSTTVLKSATAAPLIEAFGTDFALNDMELWGGGVLVCTYPASIQSCTYTTNPLGTNGLLNFGGSAKLMNVAADGFAQYGIYSDGGLTQMHNSVTYNNGWDGNIGGSDSVWDGEVWADQNCQSIVGGTGGFNGGLCAGFHNTTGSMHSTGFFESSFNHGRGVFDDGTGLPDWQSSHAYSVGDDIYPTANNAGSLHYYVRACVGNCHSGGSAPNPWPQTQNSTFTDGNVTWLVGGPYTNIAAPDFVITDAQINDNLGDNFLAQGTSGVPSSRIILNAIRIGQASNSCQVATGIHLKNFNIATVGDILWVGSAAQTLCPGEDAGGVVLENSAHIAISNLSCTFPHDNCFKAIGSGGGGSGFNTLMGSNVFLGGDSSSSTAKSYAWYVDSNSYHTSFANLMVNSGSYGRAMYDAGTSDSLAGMQFAVSASSPNSFGTMCGWYYDPSTGQQTSTPGCQINFQGTGTYFPVGYDLGTNAYLVLNGGVAGGIGPGGAGGVITEIYIGEGGAVLPGLGFADAHGSGTTIADIAGSVSTPIDPFTFTFHQEVVTEMSVKLADSGNCTLSTGACSTQTLSRAYHTAPICVCTWSGTGTVTGILSCPSTAAGGSGGKASVTPTDSVSGDTGHINFACFGN